MQASINIGNESDIYRLSVGDTRGCRQVLILVMRVTYIVLKWGILGVQASINIGNESDIYRLSVGDTRGCRQVLILVRRVSYIVLKWGILGCAGKY